MSIFIEIHESLPPGYTIVQDRDFIYLRHMGEEFATISTLGETPEEVKKMVAEYVRKHKGGG